MVYQIGKRHCRESAHFQGCQLVGHLEFRCWLHCNVPHQYQLIFFQVSDFSMREGFLSIKATGNRSHHTNRTSTNDDSIKMFHSSIVPQKQEMKSPLVKNAINQFHIPSANHHLLHQNCRDQMLGEF